MFSWQISALQYVKEHYKYNARAEHYLLIGPWDHFGSQAATKPSTLRGYAIDSVAQIDTPEITFQWFDYVMRGGRNPELLRDRINYEEMGSNEWKHAPVSVAGTLSGVLNARINKKDMDVGVVLYEVLPDGTLFQLTYFLGRASFARDMTVRHLLRPGRIEAIPFDRTRLVSRRLRAGSRLLVVLDVNKNSFHEVNYGTGKDVSTESIADATPPLRVEWRTDS